VRSRPPEEIALEGAAAVEPEQDALRLRLHAFGEHGEAERVGIATTALTIARSLSSSSMSRTKERSIFN